MAARQVLQSTELFRREVVNGVGWNGSDFTGGIIPTTGTAVNASGTSHNAAGATEFDPAANSYILASFCAGAGSVTSWAVETSPQTYVLMSAVNTRMMVEGLANSGVLTDEVPTATSVGSTATKCVSIAINSITQGGGMVILRRRNKALLRM